MESFFVKLYGKGKKKNGLKLSSKCLIILAIVILISLLSSTVAMATYQSRPGFTALVNTTSETFFKQIRQMETSSGPLGLNATLDDSYNDTSNNGIDVHMIKNSEWGAVAMLAMSGYGGGAVDQIDSYSTGSNNYTGVYGMGNGNYEYMMTFASTDGSNPSTSASSYQNNLVKLGIDSKYYDLYYVTSYLASSNNEEFYGYNYAGAGGDLKIDHKGDAIYEMYQIMKSIRPDAYTYNITLGNPFFLRGSSGSGGTLASNGYNGGPNSISTSRAVVVCGSGL